MHPQMTFEELIALTTLQDCIDCGLKHAAVRSCEDAKQWADYKKAQEADK